MLSKRGNGLIKLSAKLIICMKFKKRLAFFNEVVYSMSIKGKYERQGQGCSHLGEYPFLMNLLGYL